MINPIQLCNEITAAGIKVSGCNTNGVVWDEAGNEIQDRKEVKAIVAAHKPEQPIINIETRMTLLESKLSTIEKSL